VGTWQGGYGARTRPAEGIHDDLYARAVVLAPDGAGPMAAVVSLDIVSVPHDVAAAARRLASALSGIPAGNIALCASHTHGGPLTRGNAGAAAPQPDDDYLRVLEKIVAGAVAAAARDLQPVALRLGRGQAAFHVNRRLRSSSETLMRPNPDGPIDRDVVVLRLDPAGGPEHPPDAPSPLAVLFRFTCHATAMGAQNYRFTADYPGAAAAFVERAYGGQTTALFLQGCTGDIRPRLVDAEGGFRSATWPELAAIGREVGGAAVGAAESARPPAPEAPGAGGDRLGVAGRTVPLVYAPLPDAGELRALLAAGRWPTGSELSAVERHWAERVLESLAAGTAPEPVLAEVQVFRLGAVWLVTLPGEVFVEIGWRVRDAVAAAAGVDPGLVVVAAYANGNVGYVPTGAAIPEGGYEVTAYRHMGRLAGYAAETELLLAATAAELTASLVA
jgi:hypothetical protein